MSDIFTLSNGSILEVHQERGPGGTETVHLELFVSQTDTFGFAELKVHN